MPSITGLNLNIGAGRNSTRRTVTVTYQIRFSTPESLGNQVFRERVTLRGDDPVFDDNVMTVFTNWTRAQAAPLNRTITRDVARSSLDEDPDTIIFGFVLGNLDELYARVELTPFSPGSAQADSNVVTGQFGPAGA